MLYTSYMRYTYRECVPVQCTTTLMTIITLRRSKSVHAAVIVNSKMEGFIERTQYTYNLGDELIFS